MKTLSVALMMVFSAASAHAAMHTETVDYRLGGTVLEGFLAYDDSSQAKRPGVLVVHEWMGLDDYARKRAVQLAEMGYVAFAVDMYGKGVRPKTHQEAATLSGMYKADRQLMRSRAQAGLDVLKNHPMVDPQHVAAIGYCFGGTTVLELARSGADLAGVVSFHGALGTPNRSDAKKIKAKVLVLHGGSDPLVPAEEVELFQEEMTQAQVDWQMIIYGGAVHSFTNPASGDDPSKGVAYNARAARRSWQAMELFFKEVVDSSGK